MQDQEDSLASGFIQTMYVGISEKNPIYLIDVKGLDLKVIFECPPDKACGWPPIRPDGHVLVAKLCF